MTQTPQSVMRTYMAITGLFTLSASFIWGVNTLFLLEAGLSLTQTFVANAFYTVGMVLFEIPTGVVADTLGRRTSFLASLVVLALGTIAYIVLFGMGAPLWMWAIASILLGLGFTFYSGAVEAWVVDALDAVGYDGPQERIFARGGQVSGAAMLIGTLTGGLLGQVDLALPYIVRTGLLVACLVVAALWMRDLGFEKRAFEVKHIPREMRTVTRTSLDDGWRKPAVKWLLLTGAVHGTFLIWGWYAWQPHFVQLAGGAIWVAGALAATWSLMLILGNGLAAKATHLAGDRKRVLITAQLIMAAGFLGVSLANSFWPAVLSYLAAMAAFGIHEPVRNAMLHALLASRTRATVISFGGMIASAGGVVSQIGLARYAEVTSIPDAYLIGSVWTLVAVPFVVMAAKKAPDACDPSAKAAAP